MADEVVFWDRLNAEHRARFGLLLAPLIAASRTKDYESKEKATVQLHTWMLSMRDVSPEILEQAIANLVSKGVTWMPKPGDVKKECAAIVERKRALIRQSSLSGCTHASQWIDGPNGLKRCPCWTVMQKALELVERPIALLPSREEASDVLG